MYTEPKHQGRDYESHCAAHRDSAFGDSAFASHSCQLRSGSPWPVLSNLSSVFACLSTCVGTATNFLLYAANFPLPLLLSPSLLQLPKSLPFPLPSPSLKLPAELFSIYRGRFLTNKNNLKKLKFNLNAGALWLPAEKMTGLCLPLRRQPF